MSIECYRLLIFRYTFIISYGCYLAIGKGKLSKVILIICFVVGMIYIIMCSYMGIKPVFTSYWTSTSIWACLFLVPSISLMLFNSARNVFFEYIGKASYDIFLIQMVYYNFADFVYQQIRNRMCQLLLNIVICLVGGILFSIIEKPVTKKVYSCFLGLFLKYKQRQSVRVDKK